MDTPPGSWPDRWLYDGRNELGAVYGTPDGLYHAFLPNGARLGAFPTAERAIQAIFDDRRRGERQAA